MLWDCLEGGGKALGVMGVEEGVSFGLGGKYLDNCEVSGSAF